ncbi:MAG: hypothetical protein AAFW95_06210, partial [Cyanobacteria bacterium J06638_6]
MTVPPYSSTDILAHNWLALTELQRAVTLRPHRFSLVLARCNYTRLQRLVVDYLQATTPLVERSLPPHTTTLLRSLTAEPLPTTTTALMVTGLEQIREVTAVFKAVNLGRNAFAKAFPFPVVLWVSDRTLAILNRHAPDFKSFAAAPISFDYPPGELIYSLHQSANDLFATMLSLGDTSPYHAQAADYRQGSTLRNELEFALADIAATQASLDGELKASLDFLKGRDAMGRGDLDVSRYHFEQSLGYWQKVAHRATPGARPMFPTPPSPRQKQAVLLFYLGAAYRSQAVLQRIVYERMLHKAESHLGGCLRIFRDLGQLDLVGNFIPALAEVLQKL